MSLTIFLLIFLFPFGGFSAKEETQVVTKETSINSSTEIVFENKVGPLTVQTGEPGMVKVTMNVTIDGEPQAVQKVMDALKNLDFSASNGQIIFNTKFYTQWNENFPGGIKIILINGMRVSLSKLKISYLLTVPMGNPLAITSKYEEVTIPNLSQKLTLNLYESNFSVGQITNSAIITLKYSKGKIESVRNCELNMYESKLTMTSCGDADIITKYSTLSISNAGNLQVNAYEDNLTFYKHGNVEAKGKYTSFTLADFDSGAFDLYESKLKMGHVNTITITSKYTTFSLLSASKITFLESYECSFHGLFIRDLSIKSSYGKYSIEQLAGSLDLTGYEDNMVINQMNKNFTGITVDGKYNSVEITFEKPVSYKLEADLKYTSLIYPKEQFQETYYHKDGSEFRIKGSMKGTSEGSVPSIRLNLYEGKVELK